MGVRPDAVQYGFHPLTGNERLGVHRRSLTSLADHKASAQVRCDLFEAVGATMSVWITHTMTDERCVLWHINS